MRSKVKRKSKTEKRPMCEAGKVYRAFFYSLYKEVKHREYYVKSFVGEARAFDRVGMFISYIPKGKATIDFYLHWGDPFITEKSYPVWLFEHSLNKILDEIEKRPELVRKYEERQTVPQVKPIWEEYEEHKKTFASSGEILDNIGVKHGNKT